MRVEFLNGILFSVCVYLFFKVIKSVFRDVEWAESKPFRCWRGKHYRQRFGNIAHDSWFCLCCSKIKR